MARETASAGEQWELVVRRSFGIADVVTARDAREVLIGHLEDQLHANGWQNPTRAVAEPILDAFMALGATGDLDDQTAYRLIEQGMTVVDPVHLVFDVRGEYPPEVVAAARQLVDRVGRYAGGLPPG